MAMIWLAKLFQEKTQEFRDNNTQTKQSDQSDRITYDNNKTTGI